MRTGDLDVNDREMSYVQATRGLVAGVALPAVLQRPLPAHRFGGLAHRATHNSGRNGGGRRSDSLGWAGRALIGAVGALVRNLTRRAWVRARTLAHAA